MVQAVWPVSSQLLSCMDGVSCCLDGLVMMPSGSGCMDGVSCCLDGLVMMPSGSSCMDGVSCCLVMMKVPTNCCVLSV